MQGRHVGGRIGLRSPVARRGCDAVTATHDIFCRHDRGLLGRPSEIDDSPDGWPEVVRLLLPGAVLLLPFRNRIVWRDGWLDALEPPPSPMRGGEPSFDWPAASFPPSCCPTTKATY
jgi:hypothetical protein